ncbi:uncharacterized protein LOC111246983 [Varroa destructor]|uniref:Uncharacterized protein n=1 Tax=Varroa destructor TaxID=109461 RepID=A0A7M7JK87_VARDE|nr:uncharacterized protein LOC111246983 [Varroa destructor]
MAAAQRLSDVPPCPEGLRPFPTQSVRLRLDATPESTERKRLLQLLCAGACTQALLLASPTPLDELPSRRPSWAFLPANLPYSFLEQLAEYVRGRDMIVVFPSSSVIERFHLSEELRARGVVCKFFSEPPSWHTLNENGVLLVPSIRPPAGHKQRAYDGVLLPPGVEQWTEITCGSFRIEPDLPSKYLPSVCRNAFVNEHLETLIARMETVSDHNGLPVMLTSCPGRSLHDVDLCSAQWALIIEPSLELGRARCRVAVKKAFIGLCERLVHVAETSSYKRLTIVVLVPKLCPAINHIACFVRKKVGDRCAIKVVLAETKPLEQQLIELIEESGDDFADYVAHVRRNNEPSACP